MDAKTFDEIITRRIGLCLDMLGFKSNEYATEDRLHNFKVAAKLGKESREDKDTVVHKCLQVLNEQPTIDGDMVPVVRCGKCEFSEDRSHLKYNGKRILYCTLHSRAFEEDNFCIYGMRKGGAE